MAKGFFLVFEGPEGSGKSTQIRRLGWRLREAGLDHVLTREPGGTPAGDAIRQVILNPGLEINAMTEFLLYSASRAQHVDEVIKPALERGKLVVSDRFAGASLAYQGYGRGLDRDFIVTLTGAVTDGLEPGLTILMDIDVRRGLARVAARGQKDRLERADVTFHERVREGFLAQAKEKGWPIVDAQEDEEALAEKVWQLVRERIVQEGML